MLRYMGHQVARGVGKPYVVERHVKVAQGLVMYEVFGQHLAAKVGEPNARQRQSLQGLVLLKNFPEADNQYLKPKQTATTQLSKRLIFHFKMSHVNCSKAKVKMKVQFFF